MKPISKYKNEYLKLRDEIDTLSKKLEDKHKKHLNCKNGCDLCCMDYNIFPVEFDSILDELKDRDFSRTALPEVLNEESCIFLKDHRCLIYESRPVICRTHGLPLLFTNDEGEWELSACELNFTQFDFGRFTVKNTFPQDKFNSELFLLNQQFIEANPDLGFDEFTLIPLKKLKENL
jgi:Fe-S-cluster containining protein